MFRGIEMKKFILILGLFLSLNTNVRADDFINKPNADDIKAICGPQISDEYVPDLVLKQQYVTGTACLEKQIKKLAEDVLEDEEGLQTMRNGAKNMAWILKSIEAGKEKGIIAPVADKSNRTSFIR